MMYRFNNIPNSFNFHEKKKFIQYYSIGLDLPSLRRQSDDVYVF